MKLKVRTFPDVSLTSEAHQQDLIDNKDFRLWQRNVIDEFKNLPNEEIKKILKETSFPYSICLESWDNNFNIASAFRNANAFNAEAMFYIGNKKFDRRGLTGVHNYSTIEWLSTIEEFLIRSKKYKLVGIDNFKNAKPMDSYEWKENTMVVFGSESAGLTPTMQSYCEDIVCIPTYGSVRSLNAATASGIILNDIVTKFRKNSQS